MTMRLAVGFFAVMMLVAAPPVWADEISLNLKKLKALNSCEGCDLSGSDLKGADLEGANLYRANLSGADLIEANLFGANLKEANLYKAILTEASLKNAKFKGAILCKTATPWGIDNSGCKSIIKK